MNKLVLGTVQFGLQYGVNSSGRPNKDSVKNIIDAASKMDIITLDTSSAYGNAEAILGECMSPVQGFRVISKYPKGNVPINEMFRASLCRMNINHMYGYLLHHFDVFKENNRIWDEFIDLRSSGLVKKIGFSLYSPEELEYILKKNISFDLLQVPYNIFDKKFGPYMKNLHDDGVEIHVRSTFLQGLFFKDRDTLSQKMMPLKKYLVKLDEYSKELGLSISEIALNHNLQNPYIDGVLIGVDNVSQLQENISSITDKNIDIQIEVGEQELLNPVNW